jgi:acyl carrier protein
VWISRALTWSEISQRGHEETKINAIEERIAGVLTGNFKLDASVIGSKRTFADLSIDSLVILEVGMALEDEFGVPIDDGELHDHMTISDVASLIESKGALALWSMTRGLSARPSPALGS